MDEINIKEEVYKCSKCGLCQSVCPIFLATKNELFLPRGRYIVLNNFFNNGKILSKNFIKSLDICLNCNECKKFCPSNIDSESIYTILKSCYYRHFIPFWVKFKIILLFHSIKKYFIKSPLYRINTKRERYKTEKNGTVVYFQGCYNKYINPSDKNAVLNLLEKNGYKVVKIFNKCCGLPYLSDGKIKAFEKNAGSIIKLVPKDVKYLVTSCDSCYKTLSKIQNKMQVKLIKIDELINFTSQNSLYFKPYSQESYNGKLTIINKKGACSLMENFFVLKHPKMAANIIKKLFYKKEEIEGKTIITSCNLTKWGLINACKYLGIKCEIYSLSEFENNP